MIFFLSWLKVTMSNNRILLCFSTAFLNWVLRLHHRFSCLFLSFFLSCLCPGRSEFRAQESCGKTYKDLMILGLEEDFSSFQLRWNHVLQVGLWILIYFQIDIMDLFFSVHWLFVAEAVRRKEKRIAEE